MTDTEKVVLERRIDELCADIEQMRKIATMLASARTDLLAENAALRQQLVDVANVDELYAELGRMQLNLDMWHDRAEDMRNRLSAAQVDKTKLQKLCADLYAEMISYSNAPNYNASVWAPKLRELGVEVDAYDRDR